MIVLILKLTSLLGMITVSACLNAERKALFASMAGIYTEETSLNRPPTLQKTILITVHDSSLGLDQYFNNLICICRHYHYKLLMYTLGDEEKAQQSLMNSTHVKFISFPTHSLDKYHELLKPRLLRDEEIFHVDYNTSIANISTYSFGPLVKYIPMLEILSAGYHVLHLDPNIAIFHDVLPYLFPSSSYPSSEDLFPSLNMIALPNIPNCVFPSFHSLLPKTSLQINNGFVFFRTSNVTLDFVSALILELMHQYAMFDGEILIRIVSDKQAEWVGDCNSELFFSSSANSSLNATKNLNTFRYCLLNEFRFQNGIMASHCSQGYGYSDFSVIDLYQLGMEKFGVRYPGAHRGQIIYSPLVTVYSHSLHSFAAYSQSAPWLYQVINNTEACIPFNLNSSFYGSQQKVETSRSAVNMRLKKLRSTLIESAMYVFAHQPQIFFTYFKGQLVQEQNVTSKGKVMTLWSFLHFLLPIQLKYPFVYVPTNHSIYDTKHPLTHHRGYMSDYSTLQRYMQVEDFSLVQPSKLLQYKRHQWQENLLRDDNPSRNETVRKVLAAAAGVYVHEQPTYLKLYPELSKTVLLVYYEPSGSQEYYLFNLICLTRHYQLKLVIYILDRKIIDFKKEKLRLESLSPYVSVLTYPYHLLWSFVLRKTTTFMHSSQVDISRTFTVRNLPSFKDYCDTIKFIPIYEVLTLGFGVIYLDTDIALLKDPIPFLMRGEADLSFSIEIRGCTYPTVIEAKSGYRFWNGLEPNVGVVRLRPTVNTVQFVSTWISMMLENSLRSPKCAYGQKLFSTVSRSLKAIRRSDCNSESTSPLLLVGNISNTAPPSFCFLSELMFANGYMEYVCGKNRIGLNRQANRTLLLDAFKKHGSSTAYSLPAESKIMLAFHPAGLHLNHIPQESKLNEMETKGYQVYDRSNQSCLPFNFSRSYYAKNI